MPPRTRLRRNRRTDALRRLSQESTISADKLILPLFVVSGKNRQETIPMMPEFARLSADLVATQSKNLKVKAVLLFGVCDAQDKDEEGSAALLEEGIVPTAVRAIKKERPDLAVITDVCLCGYTSHGHCGLIASAGEVDNDRSIEIMGRIAVAHAAAGADIVAPSAMMDAQVATIRTALDGSGFKDTGIMSYATKFASSFYGPFRDAARSAPAFGDRRSYQLPPSNRKEAIRDALLDEAEGADWLMVKPALPYLDVLSELRSATRLPIAAYQVSGEYAMLKYASAAGAISEYDASLESIICIRRAGADAIISYYAEEICRWIGY